MAAGFTNPWLAPIATGADLLTPGVQLAAKGCGTLARAGEAISGVNSTLHRRTLKACEEIPRFGGNNCAETAVVVSIFQRDSLCRLP